MTAGWSPRDEETDGGRQGEQGMRMLDEELKFGRNGEWGMKRLYSTPKGANISTSANYCIITAVSVKSHMTEFQ